MKLHSRFLFLFCLALGLRSPSLFAVLHVGEWPQDGRVTAEIFTPWLLFSNYSDIEGLAHNPKEDADDLDHYLFLSPSGVWETPRSCNKPARPPGHIQTVKYVHEFNDARVQIAVPISLRLHTAFLGNKKEHLLNSTLMTIRVFALDGDDANELFPGLSPTQRIEMHARNEVLNYELKELHSFPITIRDICDLSDTCRPALRGPNTPVDLTFEQIVMTPFFLLKRGDQPYLPDPLTGRMKMIHEGRIRVRVNWSFDAICDEEEFRFKIGDQIRIIR